MMKANISNVTAALLLAAMIAGCGSEQDSAEDTAAASDRTEPVWDVKQESAAAADSMEESAEAAGEAIEEAGDEAAQMANEASDDFARMADDTGDEAAEMVNEAGEQAREMAQETSQMASEAGDQAEQAMADAAGTMSTDDGAAASGDSGDPCVVDVEVGDSLSYSVDSISVPSSCESVTINLAHTGTLPKEAMGHNWVLAPADSLDAIGQAGMSAGPENDYVPDDDRIVASTEIIGGGERTSVTFSLDDLEDGVDYAFVCTFPGHWSVMRGPFNVE